MFIEFNTKNHRVYVDVNKIIYIHPGYDGKATWIVFGPNDFEILVEHPCNYVIQQIGVAKLRSTV